MHINMWDHKQKQAWSIKNYRYVCNVSIASPPLQPTLDTTKDLSKPKEEANFSDLFFPIWISQRKSIEGANLIARSRTSFTVAALPAPRQLKPRRLIAPGGIPRGS